MSVPLTLIRLEVDDDAPIPTLSYEGIYIPIIAQDDELRTYNTVDLSIGHAHFLVYHIFIRPCRTNKCRKWREMKRKH